MSKNILIINNDPNVCAFLVALLRHKGYGVKSYLSAEPGLDELLTSRYDLVLLDIFLPGLSGPEVCQALATHSDTRRLPVLLMPRSQKEADQLHDGGESGGTAEILLKPFSLDQLTQRVERLIGAVRPGPPPSTLEVQGRLAETPFAQLLHNLYTLRVTGLLQLERQNVHKVIYLRDGYPIFARSNLVRECLGQMLVTREIISQDDCDASVRLAKGSARLHGTVLLEMELLTPHQLHDALQEQITERVLEIFSWPFGEYRFIQARNFKKEVTAINLCPATLILEGIRRFSPEEGIAELLAPHRNRYPLPSENPQYLFQGMRLSQRDARVFAACSGARTFDQIIASHPLLRRETEKLLAALLVAGMVESSPEKAHLAEESIHDDAEGTECRELREAVLADYGRIMPQDYFALFSLPRDAGRAETRKAYFTLAKIHHPDRYFHAALSADLKGKINEIFQRISEAYGVLSDPAQQKAYLAKITGSAEIVPSITDILQAENAYQRGLILLKVRKFAEAAETLAVATKLSPSEPDYLTHYAWALHKKAPTDEIQGMRAREILLRSLDLNPSLDLTHLYLGYLLRDAGMEREAERSFELAVACNPNCTNALRELRLTHLRRDPPAVANGKRGR